MSTERPLPPTIGYAKLTAVWLGLLLLTGGTVGLAHLDLGLAKIWGALFIASAKAGLVITYFMHLRYEGRLLPWFLFVTLATLAIFIGFTFVDVLYR